MLRAALLLLLGASVSSGLPHHIPGSSHERVHVVMPYQRSEELVQVIMPVDMQGTDKMPNTMAEMSEDKPAEISEPVVAEMPEDKPVVDMLMAEMPEDKPVMVEMHEEKLEMPEPVLAEVPEDKPTEEKMQESPVMPEVPVEQPTGEISEPIVAEMPVDKVEMSQPIVAEINEEKVEMSEPIVAEVPEEKLEMLEPVMTEVPEHKPMEEKMPENPIIAEVPEDKPMEEISEPIVAEKLEMIEPIVAEMPVDKVELPQAIVAEEPEDKPVAEMPENPAMAEAPMVEQEQMPAAAEVTSEVVQPEPVVSMEMPAQPVAKPEPLSQELLPPFEEPMTPPKEEEGVREEVKPVSEGEEEEEECTDEETTHPAEAAQVIPLTEVEIKPVEVSEVTTGQEEEEECTHEEMAALQAAEEAPVTEAEGVREEAAATTEPPKETPAEPAKQEEEDEECTSEDLDPKPADEQKPAGVALAAETPATEEVKLTADEKTRYHGAQVLRVKALTPDQKDLINKFEQNGFLDTWLRPARSRTGELDVMVPATTLESFKQRLTDLNTEYRIIIQDVQQAIDSENPSVSPDDLSELEGRKGHRMTWSSYHRLDDIHGYLDYLAQTYPDLCTVSTIGSSVEGRPLKLLRISNKKARQASTSRPAIWIDGGIHAREWISPASVTYIIQELVENRESLGSVASDIDYYVLPVVNPDGYEYSHTRERLWRKNRRDPHLGRCAGTDLNRNWGYKWGGAGSSREQCKEIYAGASAFSEPETQAIRSFVSGQASSIRAYLTFHSYGQYILYPWGYDRKVPPDYSDLDKVGRKAAAAMRAAGGASYTVGNSANTLYPASGGADDWAKGGARIKYTYTIELRDRGQYGFLLPASFITPTAKEAFAAVKTVAEAVLEK